MSEPMLELAGIEKGYNRGKPSEVMVLRGASITIAQGEVVALVAPSGAGKSTLLHIAGLLDVPDSGTVRLDGREMGGLSDRARTEARRNEVGFIYQFHHLLPEFSALENVVIPQLANGATKARPRLGRAVCWVRLALPRGRITVLRRFRGANSNGWPSAAPWRTRPSCCWRMNRPGTLIPARRIRSLAC
jgi:predicted ABC-type transport system involved in lysophospholipase L1 biosynthesis ATPase subunit